MDATAAQLAGRAPTAVSRGAIRIEDVVKIYDPEGAAVMAVDHCTLDINAGEICMIVGPSGCGKTTLLNAVAGFHEITSGRILLDGEVLCSTENPKAAPGSDRIVVFQNGALFPWKSNLENIAFGPVMQGKLSRAEANEKALNMMADAGLSGVEHNYPGEISSGMRRRVEIVRALMNDPKVLLLDEPYRALDSLTKSVMHEALLEIYYKNRVTIFFITHDLEEAIFLGHRVAIMTTRPCRPKKILDVDIPHPRDYSVLTSGRFRELMEETNEAVHEEALKAFAAGEIGARSRQWLGLDAFEWLRGLLAWFGWEKKFLPWIGAVPAPSIVLTKWAQIIHDASYWQSWYMSFFRVAAGFTAAMIIGIPFGLLIAVSRTAYGISFPVFEVLRPIPPLAWVPASIIFWPTQELAIAFVTFLGAFYTIVINVVGGAKSIDIRYYQAAQSMGATNWDIFRRIVLPGTLPSIMVGSAVGMGITWEVVVAAEMISGGGSQIGGTAGGGLGFFIWNSYVGGSYEQIVVGMISIGIAGFISSELLRAAGKYVTPWLRLR